MPRSALALASYEARSRPLLASRLVNLYPESVPPQARAPAVSGGKGKLVLYGTPGLKSFATAGTDTIRCMRPFGDYLYALSGLSLFRIDSSGNATICGGASLSNSGVAMMSDNGEQLALLCDGLTYTISGLTITQVTDAQYPAEGASSMDYIDGYTVWSRANGGQFFISGLYDTTAIDALDFATAESSPDTLLRVLVDHRQILLFGSRSIEPWVNVGASPFPFQRVAGAVLEKGTAAALSPAKIDNTVYWLGDDRMIYRLEGYRPVRVSTHAIEEAIRVGTVSDAYAFTYAQGGHSFYVLTFPTLARTFVFDAATGLWHERQSGTGLVNAVWNPRCVAAAWGKIYAGSISGAVAELDLDTYADLGAALRWVVHTDPFYAEGRRAILTEAEIECELGVGLASGQGSDPQIMLRWSDDGGATWSNQRSEGIGATGVRRNRCSFHRLGVFRQRMLEFSGSDPVKRAIYGMRYEMVPAT